MVELVNEVDVTLIEASVSDEMVAMAAWVSHDQDNEERLKEVGRIRKLIHFLYSNKHMSPFEHGHLTFKIDAPLFVAREFFRHRTASYNEVSGRYTKMKPRFYASTIARVQKGKPGDYYFEDGDSDATAIYLQTKRKDVKRAWRTYTQRIDAGIALEQAREELPLSLMTQWYVTMNPRNLMQFLTLRNEKHALKEIQDVAVKMEAIFAEKMPITYEAYAKQREKDSNPIIKVVSNPKDLEQIEYWKQAYADLRDSKDEYAQELSDKITKLREERDDITAKYNARFVAEKEVDVDDTPNTDSVNDRHNGGYIVTGPTAKPGEVYARMSDRSVEEIAKQVRDTLERLQARRPQR